MAERTVAAAPEHDDAPTSKESTRAAERYVVPVVDIYENADGLVLLADLPGVTMCGVDIQVKDDILTIKATAVDDLQGAPVYREFELVNFFREFQLSDRVNTERISAEFKNGVLTLSLPKSEEAKPKRITVQVG